jgi:hypothetical protein
MQGLGRRWRGIICRLEVEIVRGEGAGGVEVFKGMVRRDVRRERGKNKLQLLKVPMV